ncbi:MAG TPA: MFS transporter [Flavobacteriales bacterium]|nr:MFS transporter [Flavobacteriales bacterium]
MSRSFLTLISVFFFWGFVAASNDILIPVFKNELHLEQWQSQLISFAFYIAYTVGSIIYYVISSSTGDDLLNRMGYRNGIALGLLISATGTLLFIPAANTSSFGLMITGLFIVGLGFSLQQTAANPLAIRMGDPKKGSQRLSLAGGINNIGTTIGPVLISLAIFGSVTAGNTKANIENIKTPYLILGLAFVIVAILFKFSSIPDKISSVENTGDDVAEDKTIDRVEAKQQNSFKDLGSALKYPQLWMGMIAIFLYVGVEVSTGGNLGAFLEKEMGLPTEHVAPFVSLFWASLMIGRWTNAAGVFSNDKNVRTLLSVIMPYMAFGLFLLINYVVGTNIGPFYYYAGIILVLIAADFMSKGNPARQLFIFSFMGILALFVGILSNDPFISAYAFMSVGLFCSTLWPCIFTLAISGLGKYTNQGSGFLIMMIMGGGFISLLQGYLAGDNLLGIKWSYLVGVACFAYLAFYAWKAKNILLNSGINYDEGGSGH